MVSSIESCIPQDYSQQELAEMMIGKKLIQLARSNINTGKDIFSINNLSQKSDDMFGVDLKNISLSIMKGSIVGIAGVAGNGQDELMELLIGEIVSPPGILSFKGGDIGNLNSHERRQLSMFFIPEERLGHGAVPEMGLNENMLLSRPQKSQMTSYGVIDWGMLRNLHKKLLVILMYKLLLLRC